MPKTEKDVALKFDDGKADLSQVTWELLEGLARVRMFGEKKYARDNWKKGFKVTRSLSACLRHLFKFLAGETTDTESGLCHLFHAVACLEHAIYDLKHHPENDDRTLTPPTSEDPALISALEKDLRLFGGGK